MGPVKIDGMIFSVQSTQKALKMSILQKIVRFIVKYEGLRETTIKINKIREDPTLRSTFGAPAVRTKSDKRRTINRRSGQTSAGCKFSYDSWTFSSTSDSSWIGSTSSLLSGGFSVDSTFSGSSSCISSTEPCSLAAT